MDKNGLKGTELAVSMQDSFHDRVRAIDPIGGDLSIRCHLIGSTDNSPPVRFDPNKKKVKLEVAHIAHYQKQKGKIEL